MVVDIGRVPRRGDKRLCIPTCRSVPEHMFCMFGYVYLCMYICVHTLYSTCAVLCFHICSGSMKNHLPLLKETLKFMVQQLRGDDKLCLITFDHEVE